MQARAIWYLMMSSIQNDDELQLKGFLLVIYNTVRTSDQNKLNLFEEIAFVQKLTIQVLFVRI